MVIKVTTAVFASLVLSISGFVLPTIANISISMIYGGGMSILQVLYSPHGSNKEHNSTVYVGEVVSRVPQLNCPGGNTVLTANLLSSL
jgi:hypothetical protein